jgi:hypothetical protein
LIKDRILDTLEAGLPIPDTQIGLDYEWSIPASTDNECCRIFKMHECGGGLIGAISTSNSVNAYSIASNIFNDLRASVSLSSPARVSLYKLERS